MIHPKLYTKDTSGQIRVWCMERDGSRYRSISGVLNGTLTESGWTQAVPKNVGRSNATTAEEQAIAEITAEYNKKLDRKYYSKIEAAMQATAGGHKFTAPMLALKYGEVKIEHPIYSQPKLDGFRCIASPEALTSRSGKEFNVQHIERGLSVLFNAFPGIPLDGELYSHSHRHDFNQLSSLIKNAGRDQSSLCYHIYDVLGQDGSFFDRLHLLKEMHKVLPKDGPIKIVPTHRVRDQDHLDELFGEYLRLGFEGQMIRQDGFEYEGGKRSKSLLKRKTFIDQEFPITNVGDGDGIWAGRAKWVEFKAPNDARCEDGSRPRAGIRGDLAFTRDLLLNWQRYKLVTVRFPNWTPGGVPRAPVAVAWHESENKD